MITDNSTANAVGGRTARACDNCLRRRARWYCPADDAFLCQGCDVSVHSANQLARRHERVRLQTASFKVVEEPATNDDSTPAWHRGFTRKARTPRNPKTRQSKRDKSIPVVSPGDHVPEMGSEFDFNNSIEENEEQSVCRVPVFDPFEDEFCSGNNNIMIGDDIMVNDDVANDAVLENGDAMCTDDLDVSGILPSEVDLAEFAVDVESLLEKEVADVVVKIEDAIDDGAVIMQSPSPLELTFDVEEEKVIDWGLDCVDARAASVVEAMLPPPGVEETKEGIEVGKSKCEEMQGKKRKMLLRLNYEAIMADWASHASRSPWTTGCRPEFDLDDQWLNCMVPCSSGNIQNQTWGDHMGIVSVRVQGGGDDRGREARVSRYREKRRTRMFSKKIRYQVRKLNAEKRPRMKGRFVKRTSLFGDHGRPSLCY